MGENLGETMSSLPSRRSVAKGAAWASPVLVASSLAPSVAASPGQDCAAATAKVVSYSFGANVPGTPILSGLTGSPRPFAAGDTRQVSSFPQSLIVTAAAGNTCTIPAGTIVARLRADLYSPAVSQLNNSIEVWKSDGTGDAVEDSIFSGHEVTIVTDTRLGPGGSVVIPLTYVAKSLYEYVSLLGGDLLIRLTARQPAAGSITAPSVTRDGTRSTVGLLGSGG